MDNSAGHKQKRRQAAGAMISGLLKGGPVVGATVSSGSGGTGNTGTGGVGGGGGGGGSSKKKSTAQPRPEISIPPKGIGPVAEPNPNDVLCGRGGRINAHAGNIQFRDIVQTRKKDYLAKSTKKLEKAHIAAEVVYQIRGMTPPGRFLKEDADGAWYDIGDAKAIKKVGQALREDAPELRNDQDDLSDDNGDETPVPVKKKPVSPKATTPTVEIPESSYVPLVSQAIQPPPQYDRQVPVPSMPPPQAKFQQPTTNILSPSHLISGILPQSNVSGAAAAAIAEDDILERDEAFGRPFYQPPPLQVSAQRESSLISGLSGPSVMSGLSFTSERSDRLSTLSASDNNTNANRKFRFHFPSRSRFPTANGMRQSNNTNSITGSDLTGTRHFLSHSGAGVGSSLNRSYSNPDLMSDAMSVAQNSLQGGAIGDNYTVADSITGMQSVTMSDVADRFMEGGVGNSHGSRHRYNPYYAQPAPFHQQPAPQQPPPPAAAGLHPHYYHQQPLAPTHQ